MCVWFFFIKRCFSVAGYCFPLSFYDCFCLFFCILNFTSDLTHFVLLLLLLPTPSFQAIFLLLLLLCLKKKQEKTGNVPTATLSPLSSFIRPVGKGVAAADFEDCSEGTPRRLAAPPDRHPDRPDRTHRHRCSKEEEKKSKNAIVSNRNKHIFTVRHVQLTRSH